MSDSYPIAPQQTPASSAPPASPQREPDSIGKLVGLLIKQLMKSLPMRLVMAGVIFVVVWIVHTLLLAGPNGGFAPNDGSIFGGFDLLASLLGQTLALSGRFLGGTMFWFMLSITVSSLIAGLRTPGGAFLSRMGSLGEIIGSSFAAPRLGALLAGAGAGALVAGIFDNRFVGILFAVAAVFAIASGDSDFSHVVMRCTYNDARKALSKSRRRLNATTADAFLVGFALAALAYALIFLLPGIAFIVLGMALLVGAAVVAQNAAAAGSVAGVLLAFLVFGLVRSAFGDDGGFSEASGPWILSEGAAQAIAMGVPPAMAAALGAIIGALGPELGGMFVSGILPTLLSPPRGPRPGVHGGGGPGQCTGGLPNYWIDTASGRLSITDRIAGWRGLGPEVSLSLAWDGPEGGSGAFGRGWAFAHDGSVSDDGHGIIAAVGGLPVAFDAPTQQPGQPAVALQAGGGPSRLTGYPGVWIWENPVSGMTRRFDAVPGGSFALTAVTDRNGLSVTLQRDTAGRLVSLTDASGRIVTFQLEASGRIGRFVMPDGRSAAFDYSAAGDLIRSTDLAGITTEYTFDAGGLMTAMVVGRDRKTTLFGWQAAAAGPQIISVTDADGAVTRYDVVPGAGRVVRVTDAEGRAIVYRSEAGRTVEIADAAGSATGYDYDGAGRVTAITDARGTLRTDYDAAGRVVRVADPLGRVTSFAYDANGDLVSRTMPDGGSWRFTHDARRNLREVITPGGRKSSIAWDERGLMTSQTLAGGGTYTYEHDAFGNAVGIVDPEGSVRRLTYDAFGLRTDSVRDPAGAVTSFEYDANDRVTRSVFPDGTETRSIYDCCTEVAVTDEAGVTTGVDRDPMMRPLAYTDTGTVGLSFTYDRAGRMTSMSMAGTVLARFEVDAPRRSTKAVLPDGSVRELTSDVAGRPVRMRSSRGYTAEITRDAGGRPVAVTDPYGRTEAGFDANDNLLWVRNARGHVVEMGLDPDGLPVSRKVNGAETATYSYDARGVLANVGCEAGAARFETGPSGRITGIAYSDGTSAAFEHDAKGQLAAVSLPDGVAIRYEYNSRGAMTSASFGKHRCDWTYGATGLVAAETRSNNVNTTYTWNNGAILGIKHGPQGLFDVTWERDSMGRTVRAQGTRAIGPVPGSRKEIGSDATGRVSLVGGKACSYDADGNLTERDGSYRVEHDPENRLVLLEPAGETATRYTYDGFGRIWRRQGPDGVREYHRDATGRMLFETDGAGKMLVAHVWRGPFLVASLRDEEALFYHTDSTANCVAVTDGKGDVAAAYDYDAFGAITASAGPEASQPFRFAGCAGVTAQPSGLYHAGARFYDPAMGAFLEKDPTTWSGSMEPYEYCGGDPVNAFDATGFEGAGLSFADEQRAKDEALYGRPPAGKYPSSTPFVGGEKIVSGMVNTGVGGYLTYGAGLTIYAGLTGATAITPVGWGLAIGGLLLAGSRLVMGVVTAGQGMDNQGFGPNQSPVTETIDPTGGMRKMGYCVAEPIVQTATVVAAGGREIGNMVNDINNVGDPFYEPQSQSMGGGGGDAFDF